MKKLGFLPLLLLFSEIGSGIEIEISAPSFPDIARFFFVPESTVGLTLSYNMVGFCIASLLYGPLSDSFGRRKLMIWGNALLLIGSLACTLASSIDMLLFFRFVQGLGAAASAVLVPAIIADVYSLNKASHLYSLMNAFFSCMMAIGPLIGSFLNSTLGWRGNYGFVTLICIVSWIFIIVALPETKSHRKNLSFQKTIVNYKTIFFNFKFLLAAMIPSLLYASYLSFIAVGAFIYMEIYSLTPLQYSLHQGFVVAMFALMSLLSSSFINKVGYRLGLQWGIMAGFTGSFLMLFASWKLSSNYYLLTGFMSLQTAGFAIVYPIIFSYSVEIFPELKGTAASAIMSLRYLLCACAVALATSTYNGTSFSLSLVVFSLTVTVCLMSIGLFFLGLSNKLKELDKNLKLS